MNLFYGVQPALLQPWVESRLHRVPCIHGTHGHGVR